ncbi:lysophospholipid acyltransferase family protein [Spirosoma sp. BT702]|uniref:Lysophospholipid acyltransferase family protein n=1 Tax=Spirosoma profusum TaxID=2771354 RepID=A0A927GAW5_9BACT|nr:lysophospholipid acyltransferase family protein [Spirosoma profusum]MBD2705579.1 lysophospholipid acyltransferase family protein [Spirosoma profusum]
MSPLKTKSLWFGLASFCSQLVFLVLRYGLRYRYQTIYNNLSRAFPTKKTSEIVRLLESYYRHLSDLCVEPFLFAVASSHLRTQLARFTNIQLLHRLHQANKSVILLATHYGNWEYLIQLPSYSPYPVYTAYSPPHKPWVNRLLLRLRKRFGIQLIPQQSFYRQMLARINQVAEPALMVLIADQRPGPASLKHQLLFLQQPTYVQLGAERLAQQLNAAVVFVDCVKISRFCYEYRLKGVNLPVNEVMPSLTQCYFQHLEAQIHRSPAYWLWSHDRWKSSVKSPSPSQPVEV